MDIKLKLCFAFLFKKLEVQSVGSYNDHEMVKSDRVMLGHEIEKHARNAVNDLTTPAVRDIFNQTIRPESNTTKGNYTYKIGNTFMHIIFMFFRFNIISYNFDFFHVINLRYFV